MFSNRFRNHFRFALQKEASTVREHIPINRIEKVGNILSWLAYDFRAAFCRFFFDPRTMTLFLTLVFMGFVALLFYPSDTWRILDHALTWVIDHINWRYIRFILWLSCEITVLGLGMRSFGRFSNPALMKFHGI